MEKADLCESGIAARFDVKHRAHVAIRSIGPLDGCHGKKARKRCRWRLLHEYLARVSKIRVSTKFRVPLSGGFVTSRVLDVLDR